MQLVSRRLLVRLLRCLCLVILALAQPAGEPRCPGPWDQREGAAGLRHRMSRGGAPGNVASVGRAEALGWDGVGWHS